MQQRLTLGDWAVPVVRVCYGMTCMLLAVAAAASGSGWIFWPLWGIASWLMQASCTPLEREESSMAVFGRHFSRQVQLGSLPACRSDARQGVRLMALHAAVPLRPGDAMAVVAASSALADAERLHQGVSLLESWGIALPPSLRCWTPLGVSGRSG